MKKISLKSFFKYLIISLLLIGLIGIIVCGIVVYNLAINNNAIDYNALGLEFSSVVYYTDENGNELVYEQIAGGENRLWCDLEDMPKHLPQAFIAIEDERFYSHFGVDIKRTAKATFNYIFNGDSSYGGSTINQQLVKNITGDSDRSPGRKVIEMVRAIDMDNKLSKDQIIELYLNTIYLSQGCNGVKTASDKYFGKSVDELTIAESAAIAGITQFPTKYDPILHPEANKEKKETVLWKMYELEMITKAQYDEAMKEELVFQNNEIDEYNQYESYFSELLIESLISDLQTELSLSRNIATRMVYSGGLKIYATIDPKMQDAAEDVFEHPADYIGYNEDDPIQAAIVVMDQHNGHIKAVVGGLGQKTGRRTLNRATTLRQPGSTIKPLSVYSPGFENGVFTPDTLYNDHPVKVGNHTIKNYYSGYRGVMSVRYAIQQSVNTIAAECIQRVGLERSYNFLSENLGVTTLSEEDLNVSPLALGGLTNGISVKEMTAAYCAIANNGIYYEPVTYTRVEDQQGKTVLDFSNSYHRAMKPVAADTMLSCLRSVVLSGTGTPAVFSNMPLCGKTGTTDDDKDRWFMGFSPYYTAGVWVGYDQPKQIIAYGTNPAILLWRGVMKEIHKDLEVKDFDVGDTLSGNTNLNSDLYTTVTVCADSGLLPSDLCSQDYSGSKVVTKKVLKGSEPKTKCSVHQYVKVDATTGMLATSSCPAESVVTRVQANPGVYCSVHSSGGQAGADAPPSKEPQQTEVITGSSTSQLETGEVSSNSVSGEVSSGISSGEVIIEVE